jgi:cystathionine beta-lyase/cystathionine gamma-synthase
MKQLDFATRAIHAGQPPDGTSGAVITPIFQTSTYAQPSPGKHKGYEYGRTGNPTRKALEENIASLENGRFCYTFGSGMAATSTIAGLLEAGDHVIVTNNVYGGTYRFFEQVMRRFGLEFSYVDTSDLAATRAAFHTNTKLVFIETPTNPMLRVTDIRATSELCHNRDCLLCVDNTFLSPYFQRPLEFGADVVLHSTTKYLNGHSDVIGGALVVNNERLAERIAFLQNAVGAVPGPFDCWLILRSTKTLHLRMQRHNENAITIAKFLNEHPRVIRVNYPGLESHPHYELACRQQLDPYGKPGFGGMISFDMGSWKSGKTLLEQVNLFLLAESLGGVESLISHPASMTHGSVPKDDREKLGITDGLVRISVGVEYVEDLVEDLDQALKKI